MQDSFELGPQIIRRSDWTDASLASPRIRPQNKIIIATDLSLNESLPINSCVSLEDCSELMKKLGYHYSRFNFILGANDLIFESRSFDSVDHIEDSKFVLI